MLPAQEIIEALVEHEPALPSLALIIGKPCAELHSAVVRVDAVAVLHQQDAPGRQTPNVKARVWLDSSVSVLFEFDPVEVMSGADKQCLSNRSR